MELHGRRTCNWMFQLKPTMTMMAIKNSLHGWQPFKKQTITTVKQPNTLALGFCSTGRAHCFKLYVRSAKILLLSNACHLDIICCSPWPLDMNVVLQSVVQQWNMIGKFLTPNILLTGRIAAMPCPYLGPPQTSHFCWLQTSSPVNITVICQQMIYLKHTAFNS